MSHFSVTSVYNDFFSGAPVLFFIISGPNFCFLYTFTSSFLHFLLTEFLFLPARKKVNKIRIVFASQWALQCSYFSSRFQYISPSDFRGSWQYCWQKSFLIRYVYNLTISLLPPCVLLHRIIYCYAIYSINIR